MDVWMYESASAELHDYKVEKQHSNKLDTFCYTLFWSIQSKQN